MLRMKVKATNIEHLDWLTITMIIEKRKKRGLAENSQRICSLYALQVQSKNVTRVAPFSFRNVNADWQVLYEGSLAGDYFLQSFYNPGSIVS